MVNGYIQMPNNPPKPYAHIAPVQLTSEQRQTKLDFLRNPKNLPWYSARYIKTRHEAGQGLIPVVFERAQLALHNFIEGIRDEGLPVRVCVVKGRQMHISTYVAARFLQRVTTHRGTVVFILAHIGDSTNYLFEMAKRMYGNLPQPLRPEVSRSNRKELKFASLDSEYALGTAGTDEVGRSMNPLLLHASECAFYPHTDKLTTGLFQGVPEDPASEIIMESTANGIGNFFYNLCMKGADPEVPSKYRTIFLPWFWMEKYRTKIPIGFKLTSEEDALMSIHGLTIEQMVWRRGKIDFDFEGDLWRFKQEFPCIAKGTLVSTGRGFIPIEEVISGDKIPEGIVEMALVKGIKPIIKITTTNGYSVLATEDHLIKKSDGSFIAAKDSIGSEIQLSDVIFAEGYFTAEHRFIKGVPTRWIIDEEWGLFLGLFMGDGSLYAATVSVAFDKKDVKAIEFIADFLTKIIGDPPQIRKVGTKLGGIEVRKSSVTFTDILGSLDCLGEYKDGVRKRKVKVPECIFRSPKSVVREFLRGVFDSDGFVYGNCGQIKLFAKDSQFISDIQLLLLGFGIVSKQNSVVKKAGNGSLYTGNELILGAKSARLFSEVVGFLSERKIIKSQQRPTFYSKNAEDIKFSDSVCKIDPKDSSLVYDLVVPGAHVFNANGVVVHNCTLEEAFVTSGVSLIKQEAILTARKYKAVADPMAAKILGVDGSGDGDKSDGATLVLRQGKKVLWFERHARVNQMTLAGIVARHIDQHSIDMVFLDNAYGYGARDRLREMGYGQYCQCVHFSEKSIQPEIYGNIRAQMYAYLRQWIEEGQTEIPDDDVFCRQLFIMPPLGMRGSRGMLMMAPKDEIKGMNGGLSPNDADALALTFAYPVKPKTYHQKMNIVDMDQARVNSPFKTRRFAKTQGKKQMPSELFIK